MTGTNQTYFEEPLSIKLELSRDEARKKRRITFDCFNAVVMDGRVACNRKNFANPIPLISVLRGRSTAACAACADYDDGGEACG